MGTTKMSGWALLWFLLGFTLMGTIPVGGGLLGGISACVLIVISVVLFKSARAKEEA